MFHVKQYSFFIGFLLVYSISTNYCMKINGSEHEQCSFDTLISKITIDKFCFWCRIISCFYRKIATCSRKCSGSSR